MIRDWRVDEDGVYFIKVWYEISDVLTWTTYKDRLSYKLVDAACEKALEYMMDRYGVDRNNVVDEVDGDIGVELASFGPVFTMTVRIESESGGI